MNASVSWREIYGAVVGSDPTLTHLSTPVAVISLYSWALLFCFTMYNLSRILLPKIMVLYALDFFKTMAFCTYPFGHALMRNNYGPIGFYIGNVFMNMLTSNILSKGEGSPIGNLDNYLRGHVSLYKTCLRLLSQILAGFAAFRLGLLLFKLDLHPLFTEILMTVDCDTDLKVSILFGLMFESVGIFYDSWLGRQHLTTVGLLEQFIKCSNGALLVNLGWNWTGAYLHPAMASGFTYGCKGTSTMVHVLIYWIGPFLGCYGASLIQFSLPKIKSGSQNGVMKDKAD